MQDYIYQLTFKSNFIGDFRTKTSQTAFHKNSFHK